MMVEDTSISRLPDSFDLEQLQRLIPKIHPSSAFFQRSREILDDSLEVLPPIPKPTSRREPKFLTIGMATHDDYDGVYFSIQAIRLYHSEILSDVEFLVIDNNPAGPCANALKALENWASDYRYVPYRTSQGTAVRDLIFREASGEFVLCMDSHILFTPGSSPASSNIAVRIPRRWICYKDRCYPMVASRLLLILNRSGPMACMVVGVSMRGEKMPSRPRSRSTCKAWACSHADARRGPVSIHDSPDSEARRATFTGRFKVRADETSACHSSVGCIGSSGRMAPPTRRIGQTGSGIICLFTTS